MGLWEYKVITSGPHGFASLALLEAHVNALGKDEWEIIHFQTSPTNPLAFHGLARRSTVRDWTPPEIAVAHAPKHSIYEPPPPAKVSPPIEDKRVLPPVLAEEVDGAKPSLEGAASLRPMRNTERDLDPDAADEEDDWDTWEEDSEDLPTFFEAVKPHLRRNQKGPGMSVAIDYLAKRWEQREADLVGALKECGFSLPEAEESEPDYLEFEGDLYWINKNNRGQLFINTREKPRPTFRVVQAKKLAPDDPAAAELATERNAEKAEIEKRKNERQERADRQAAAAAAKVAAHQSAAAAAAESAEKAAGEAAREEAATPAASDANPPAGAQLLEKIRPLMRRNRRGPGYSGSVSFLSRALKQTDANLIAALSSLGLNPPTGASDKPVFVEIDDCVYWINKDSRGGIWINGREKRDGAPRADGETDAPAAATSNAETGDATAPSTPASTDSPASAEPPSRSPTNSETAATAATSSEPELPLEPAPSVQETDTPPDMTTDSTSDSESIESISDTTESPFPVTTSSDPLLAAVRLLLKPNKRGSGVSGEIGFLARTLEKSDEEFLATLTSRGLSIPEDSKTKPVFVEHDTEIFWLNKSSGDGSLWLNAKASRSSRRPSTRSRAPRKAKTEEAPEEQDSPSEAGA